MKTNPRSASEMVDHQVRKWRAAQTRTRATRTPVITISHRHGSRGSMLAEAVAERLGYTCWNRQLLHEIAKRSGTSESLLASVDEHHRSSLEELVEAFRHRQSASPSEYFRALVGSVHAIAHHGSAVIVGRGTPYIVDASSALRVCVVRPLDQRIREVMSRRRIDEPEARERVRQVDQDRHQFIREHYDRDNQDPTGYDLVVNTGTLPLDCAVDAVVAVYHRRFGDPPRLEPSSIHWH